MVFVRFTQLVLVGGNLLLIFLITALLQPIALVASNGCGLIIGVGRYSFASSSA